MTTRSLPYTFGLSTSILVFPMFLTVPGMIPHRETSHELPRHFINAWGSSPRSQLSGLPPHFLEIKRRGKIQVQTVIFGEVQGQKVSWPWSKQQALAPPGPSLSAPHIAGCKSLVEGHSNWDKMVRKVDTGPNLLLLKSEQYWLCKVEIILIYLQGSLLKAVWWDTLDNNSKSL